MRLHSPNPGSCPKQAVGNFIRKIFSFQPNNLWTQKNAHMSQLLTWTFPLLYFLILATSTYSLTLSAMVYSSAAKTSIFLTDTLLFCKSLVQPLLSSSFHPEIFRSSTALLICHPSHFSLSKRNVIHYL